MLIFSAGVAAVAWLAYSLASRLCQARSIETVATALLIFTAILITPMLAAGILGVMTPGPVVGGMLVLCGVLLALRWRLPAPPSRAPGCFRASPAELLVVIGLAVRIGTQLWKFSRAVLDEVRTGTNTDVILFELPAVVEFVLNGSLWTFDQCFPYYPANYGLLLAWGVMLAKSYALNPLVQLFALSAGLAYIGAIANFVMARMPGAHRAIGALLVVVLFLDLHVQRNTIQWVGKNDLFIAFCALASFFHLMRYWSGADSGRNIHQFLAGLALGLMIGTKFSAAYWVVIMAAGHGFLLLHDARGDLGKTARRAFTHLVLVGSPVAFFAGLWALRVFLGYEFVSRDEHFMDVGWHNTILNLHAEPLIREATSSWTPYLALVLAGGLVGVAPWARVPALVRLAGLLAAYAGFHEVTSTSLYWSAYLGTFAVGLALSLLPVLAWCIPGNRGEARLGAVGLAATCSLLLFGVMPFSAWTGAGPEAGSPSWIVIAYRYTLVSFALAQIGFVALFLEVVQGCLPRLSPFRPRVVLGSLWSRRIYRYTVALAVLIMAFTPLIRSWTYERLDSLGPIWENFAAQYSEPTAIYSWARNNLQGSSILLVGLPSSHFYGEEVGDNRVFSGCRPWANGYPFDRILAEKLIDEEEVEEVVLGLQFHGETLGSTTMQWVSALREEHQVLFEDEQAIVFATEHRRPRLSSRSIDYDFSTLAARDLRLLGFHGVEWQDGKGLRWTASPVSRLWARVQRDGDLKISFGIARGVRPDTVESLRVFAEGEPLTLHAERFDQHWRFEAVVPQPVNNGDPELELKLEIDEVGDGQEAKLRSGPGPIGLLFDWLRIEPVMDASGSTAEAP